MYPSKIQKLIDLFSKFPTVGPRTAARFVFYLLKIPEEKTKELIRAMEELKKGTRPCSLCFGYFEPSPKNEELCPICSDRARDRSLFCIVEKQIDQQAIEKTGRYKGLYLILGGTMSNLKSKTVKEEIKKRADRLIEIIKGKTPFIGPSEVKEIIIALNSTTEGEITSLWLERRLKNLGIKITRLATGLPKGSELEYADEDTLSLAIKDRR